VLGKKDLTWVEAEGRARPPDGFAFLASATGNSRFESAKIHPHQPKFSRKFSLPKKNSFCNSIHVNVISLSVIMVSETVTYANTETI